MRVAADKFVAGKALGKLLGIEGLGQDYSHQSPGGLDIRNCYMQEDCSREEVRSMEVSMTAVGVHSGAAKLTSQY